MTLDEARMVVVNCGEWKNATLGRVEEIRLTAVDSIRKFPFSKAIVKQAAQIICAARAEDLKAAHEAQNDRVLREILDRKKRHRRGSY